MGGIDDQRLDQEVVPDEISGIGAVRMDPTHFASHQEYVFGPLLLEKSIDLCLAGQVQLLPGGRQEVLKALQAQASNHRGSNQPPSTSDEYL
jgi:hypothetical protein